MRVYKFLPEKWALKSIDDRKIKISQFSDLNDPFELMAATFHQSYEKTLSAVLQSLGVLCFSRGWSNPLLWSHYSDRHKGMCLGFDVPAAEEVVYFEGGQASVPDHILIKAVLGDTSALRTNVKRKLLWKFKAWSYEDEVRIHAPLVQRDGDYYFWDFDAELRLCEVIFGVRCLVAKTRIDASLRDYSDPVTVRKARLNFETFKVEEER